MSRIGLRDKIGIGKFLGKLASIQYRHYKKIIILSLILTAFLGYGATGVHFQGDLEEMMPSDLPVFVLEDKVANQFGGGDSIVIAVVLNEDTSAKNIVRDIRDPEVIRSVIELHNRLENEPSIGEVQSIAPLFQQGVPDDIEDTKRIIASSPLQGIVNRDYSVMLVYATPVTGMSEEQVKKVERVIQNDIDAITKPAGVEYRISGMAPLVVKVLELLREDLVFTTLTAAAIIFALLVILELSLSKGFLVFLPLTFAVIWTFGTMGFFGIPISPATVAVGALIIGLGVEYGIFVVSRFHEEREKHSSEDSLRIAVSEIGASTFGSAATTTSAFMALTISIMPMIRDLGFTLALAIIFCWIAAAVVNPCFIILEDQLNGKKLSGLIKRRGITDEQQQ
ncbi:MAG: efflux RND transporter permease subunit [Archaeoglobaceae archaeon]